MMRSRTIRTIIVLIASAVLLPGCAALPFALPSASAPTAGPQTVEQACVALYNFEVKAAVRKAVVDMKAAKSAKTLNKAVSGLTKVFEKYVPELRNKTVKAQAQKVLKAWAKASSLLKSPKATRAWQASLQKAAKKAETEGDKLDELCLKS